MQISQNKMEEENSNYLWNFPALDFLINLHFCISDASQAEFDGVSEVKVDTSYSNAINTSNKAVLLLLIVILHRIS